MGDALHKILTALGNPHRMRIVAALVENRTYVSALPREIGIWRAAEAREPVAGTRTQPEPAETGRPGPGPELHTWGRDGPSRPSSGRSLPPGAGRRPSARAGRVAPRIRT